MMAYEFQATINDNIIQIPAEYRNRISKKVKIILLSEEIAEQSITEKMAKKSSFPYFAVDTTGYTFDREEANER